MTNLNKYKMNKLNKMIKEVEDLDDEFKVSKDILLIRLKDCRQEIKEQLILSGVSQQRELLKVLEYSRQIKNNPKDIQLLIDKLYLENL